MKRSRLIVLIILLPISALVMVVVRNTARESSQRKVLASWTTDFAKRFDRNRSYSANQRMHREGLKSIAPIAVPLLRRDLNYDPKLQLWLDKAVQWPADHLHFTIDHPGTPAWDRRWRAAETLGTIGPEARSALPDLLRHTSDPEDLVRGASALALGNIGDHSSNVIAALKVLSANRNPYVAESAAFALWQLQPEDSAAAGRVASSIGPKSLGTISVRLGHCGEKARPFAPALRQALAQSSSGDSRAHAAQALWLITGDIEPALSLAATLIEEARRAEQQSNGVRHAKAEQGIASAGILLCDIPEFRAKLRPQLLAWSTNSGPRQGLLAKSILEWFSKAEAEKLEQ